MLKDASLRKIVLEYRDGSRIQTIHCAIVNHVIERTHAQNGLALAHVFERGLHADVDRRRRMGTRYERKRARIALDQHWIFSRNLKDFQTSECLNAFFHQPKAELNVSLSIARDDLRRAETR